MPVYTYRGVNRDGRERRGRARGARARPNSRPCCGGRTSTSASFRKRGRSSTSPRSERGVDEKELAIFTRQFSVMIDAGLPLVQCLEILAGQQENKTFQKILNGVRASVEGGATLSASMKQYEKVFDPALLQHGRGRRDGRYSRHHSAAPLAATSKRTSS